MFTAPTATSWSGMCVGNNGGSLGACSARWASSKPWVSTLSVEKRSVPGIEHRWVAEMKVRPDPGPCGIRAQNRDGYRAHQVEHQMFADGTLRAVRGRRLGSRSGSVFPAPISERSWRLPGSTVPGAVRAQPNEDRSPMTPDDRDRASS